MIEVVKGTETITQALDALDYMEGYVEVSAGKDGLERLAIVRRVLRSQALLLARCSGALKAGDYVTPTRQRIIKDIAEALPELKDSLPFVIVATVEENPVPGPTPNNPEDKIRG